MQGQRPTAGVRGEGDAGTRPGVGEIPVEGQVLKESEGRVWLGGVERGKEAAWGSRGDKGQGSSAGVLAMLWVAALGPCNKRRN